MKWAAKRVSTTEAPHLFLHPKKNPQDTKPIPPPANEPKSKVITRLSKPNFLYYKLILVINLGDNQNTT
jgi:hypothetical protein